MMKEIRRYTHLYRNIANWGDYLRFKWRPAGVRSLDFRTRGGQKISVPREVIREFKEIFMTEAYVKHFPSLSGVRTVVDVGANVGFFSLFASHRFPGATVHAYEPLPINFERLEAHRAANPSSRIVSHRVAVSGARGELEFFVDRVGEISTSASLAPSSDRPLRITVPSVTLEDVLDGNELDRCDFLKLDCEGAEFGILYSTPAAVLDRISRLAIEVHASDNPTHTHERLAAYLRGAGFRVVEEGPPPISMLWAWKA
jgi:FkbM family methyltransferase